MAITNVGLLQDLKKFINAKFDGFENRLGDRIDGVEKRLDGVETKLSGVESRLWVVEEDLHEVKLVQNEILDVVGQDSQEVKETQKSHGNRITKLETLTQAA